MEGKGRKGETRRKDGRKAGRQLQPANSTLGLPDPPSVSRHSRPHIHISLAPPQHALSLAIEIMQDFLGTCHHEYRRGHRTHSATSGLHSSCMQLGACEGPRGSEFAQMARDDDSCQQEGAMAVLLPPLREHQTVSFGHTFHLRQDEGL